MLLAVDVGNSSIEAALLDKDEIVHKEKLSNKNVIEHNFQSFVLGFCAETDIDGIVISNVVKELRPILENVCKKITPDPMFIDAFMDVGYMIDEERKSSLGADIVATSAGAIGLYGDCIVVDTGTATTFQVLKNNHFIGCVIASGLYMGIQALYDFTSLLPKITVKKPEKIVSMNTIECMQSGAFYGHAAMIEGLLLRIKKEIGSPMKVVATGGAATMIDEVLEPHFDVIDNDLIFKGLKIIYDRNRGLK